METEILISIITRHAFWKVKIDEKDSSVKKYIKPRTYECLAKSVGVTSFLITVYVIEYMPCIINMQKFCG